jgi:rare lipoprotein A
MSLITYGCTIALTLILIMILHAKEKVVSSCTASFYGEGCRGKTMANGHPFNPDALTCASHYYPLGTWLLITHDNRSVIVCVCDRGPAPNLLKTRQLDLSEAAFKQLAPLSHGLIQVYVSRMSL